MILDGGNLVSTGHSLSVVVRDDATCDYWNVGVDSDGDMYSILCEDVPTEETEFIMTDIETLAVQKLKMSEGNLYVGDIGVGAGNSSDDYTSVIQKLNQIIACTCDSEPQAQETVINGLRIIP